MTRFVLSQLRTSSIDAAALVAVFSGDASSPFSTVANTTSPSCRAPFLAWFGSDSGSLTAFSFASYSNLSA